MTEVGPRDIALSWDVLVTAGILTVANWLRARNS